VPQRPEAGKLLFDGQRVWLVDWQAAFVNDRYFDLAVAANFVVTNDADERTTSSSILANGRMSTNARDSS
jgi:thiamine kinase-like enzyme